MTQHLMLQNHAKDPSQVSEGPRGFDVTEYQKFSDKNCFHIATNLKKSPAFFEFWGSIKEAYSQLSEKAFFFQLSFSNDIFL